MSSLATTASFVGSSGSDDITWTLLQMMMVGTMYDPMFNVTLDDDA